jgi:hypothetical protein
MKKTYFFAFLLFAFSAPVAMAQSVAEAEAVLHERVTALSQRMATSASLNEGQYLQVKRLNLVMMTEMETIKARFAATPVQLDEQMAELQARYNWDLASILRPQQLAAYDAARINTLAVNER